MALHLEIVKQEKILEIIVTGTYNLDEANLKISEVFSASRETGCSLILLNVIGLETRLPHEEEVIFAFSVQNGYNEHLSRGGQKLKMAFLESEIHEVEFSSGLKVAQDENVPVNAFYNRDKAMAWLGRDANSKN